MKMGRGALKRNFFVDSFPGNNPMEIEVLSPKISVNFQRAYVLKVISVPRLMLFLNLFNFRLSLYPSRQSLFYVQ